MIKFRNELKGLFTQYWDYLTVYTACKQNLFDYIKNNNLSIQALADKGEFDFEVLKQLVSVLIEQGLIGINSQKLILHSKGDILTEDHPYSLKYACLNWGAEHLTAWQNLEYTLKSGKQVFNHIYGKPFFEYISDDKERLLNYHKAMFEYARDDYENICDVHDFSIHHSLMDVGGGFGALINIIQDYNPKMKCFLFDKPEVVNLHSYDVETIQGDFFDSIPKIANSIIMSRVIHDWDDEKAILILSKIYDSLPNDGTLYIVENIADKIEDHAAILSLNMQAMTGGVERSLLVYRNLLKVSNLHFQESKKINDLQYLIIAKK
jgi:C-methyltransferase